LPLEGKVTEELKKYQEDFLNRVHPGSLSQESGITHRLIAAGKLSSDQALNVYTRDFVLRMTELLGDHYEACWKVLGDDDFLAACEEYIKLRPSTFKSLSFYGHEFPQFLQERFEEEFEFIFELASYEMEFQRLFHCTPLIHTLGQTDLFEKKLIKRDDCFIISSNADLNYIWNKKSDADEFIWDDIDNEGIYYLYKQGYQVKQGRIEPQFKKLIQGIDAGEKIGDLISKYEEDPFLSQLDQADWASFFTMIMLNYKVDKSNY
jgi:hypothetical protein